MSLNGIQNSMFTMMLDKVMDLSFMTSEYLEK